MLAGAAEANVRKFRELTGGSPSAASTKGGY
jgi:4-hydroxy-2-oxoheptanedioate aldolase